MLVLATNGGVGTTLDFDRVDVVVTDERASGQIIKTYDLTPARLPGTVALVADRTSTAATKVEVFATDTKGVLRNYQAARVAIPSDGVAMLRMELDVACDGVYPKVACPGGSASCASAPAFACRAEEACLAGRCVPVHTFGARELPAYDAGRVSSCEPETEQAICSRRGIACGSYMLTDTCGSPRVARCGACAGEDAAPTAKLTGPGLDDCGALGVESCARSPLVRGGAFERGVNADSPATVTDFRLDAYEITVGRFRKFVDAWLGGWRPAAGSGKHAHLNGGAGLVNANGGNESGWDPAWTAYVGAPSRTAVGPSGPGATTKASWDANATCFGGFATWTSAPGANERKPMTCLGWYDALAFCVWDGGFLPSEAEWEYAAAGGSEARPFPWGSAVPSTNTNLAVYGCWFDGAGACSGTTSIAPVGSAPAGAGRWGQLDLAGGVVEWSMDADLPFVVPCTDCINVDAASPRIVRGGSFTDTAANIAATARGGALPAFRGFDYGGRCARRP
jgi:formylglycine-generating enzyme required for sulfatase activity